MSSLSRASYLARSAGGGAVRERARARKRQQRYRFSSPATSLPAADLVFWKVSHGCRGPVCLTDRFISYNVRFATMF